VRRQGGRLALQTTASSRYRRLFAAADGVAPGTHAYAVGRSRVGLRPTRTGPEVPGTVRAMLEWVRRHGYSTPAPLLVPVAVPDLARAPSPTRAPPAWTATLEEVVRAGRVTLADGPAAVRVRVRRADGGALVLSDPAGTGVGTPLEVHAHVDDAATALPPDGAHVDATALLAVDLARDAHGFVVQRTVRVRGLWWS
jgi:hypothetical protein